MSNRITQKDIKLATLLSVYRDDYDSEEAFSSALEKAKEQSIPLRYIPKDDRVSYTEAVASYFKLPLGLKYENSKGFVDYNILIKRWFAIAPAQALDVWHWTLSEFMPFLKRNSDYLDGYEITEDTFYTLYKAKKFNHEFVKAFVSHTDFISLLFERAPYCPPRYCIDELFSHLCENGKTKYALDILVACFNNRNTDLDERIEYLQGIIHKRDYLVPLDEIEPVIMDCVKKILRKKGERRE